MCSRWIVASGLFAVLLLAAGPSFAVADGWHKSLDEGLAAAAKTGKPLLVVTAWKEKV